MGVDTTANASGAFTGDGREVVFRNNHKFVIPNAANNGYLTPISLNAGAATEGVPRFKQGVLFGNDTANANILDDYEEGTFTPVVYYDSVNNHTYSEQVGTYTKIGNFCHGYIVITWDEQASSGQVKFNLPFTSSNISGTRTSGYFIYQDGLNIPSGQGSTHLILYGGQNSSLIAAYFTGGTNNSELGTNPVKLTNTHTSSHNTMRMVFHYRTA